MATAFLLKPLLRYGLKPFLGKPFPPQLQRALAGVGVGLVSKQAPGVANETCQLGTVDGRRFTPTDAAPNRAVLYLHGGAFLIGSSAVYAPLASHLAKAAGARVYVPDYRLAPEHPYPAQLDDAMTAYSALLEQGLTGNQIALGGDSAGGMLTLLTLRALRERGLPLPGRVLLISPWVDITLSGPTVKTHAKRDPLVSVRWTHQALPALCAGGVSPEAMIDLDWGWLPPTIIQVGSEEILLSDSQRLAERAIAQGAAVDLTVFDDLWHDFQLHAGRFAPADAALDALGRFARSG